VCALFGVIAAACDTFEAPTAPRGGSIIVTVRATGVDLDRDGYVVKLDQQGGQVLRSAPFVASYFIAEGAHTVSIENVAANCTVSGPTTREVAVVHLQLTSVIFEVVCVGTGVRVTAQTAGPDTPDSLRVVVDDDPAASLSANGSLNIGYLEPGSHTVTLLAPAHCTVAGGNQSRADVVLRAYTDVRFDVTCTPAVRTERIAYETSYPGRPGAWIETVRVDGTGVERLDRYGHSPSWTRDGIHIVFSDADCSNYYSFYYYYDDDQLYCVGGIVVVDPEVGNARRLAPKYSLFDPAWSPTREEVLSHQSRSNDEDELTLVDVVTSTVKPIALQGPGSASHAVWSPDGARIAFECAGLSRMPPDLCVANRDGTGVDRLTDSPSKDLKPAWSPDGTKIVFARIASPDATFGEIAVIDGFDPNATKTKAINAIVTLIAPKGRVLLVDAPFATETFRASRNLERVSLQDATKLNTLDLAQYAKIIVSTKALDTIIARANGGKN